MDQIKQMIINALDDAYINITEDIYAYDGTEETLDAYLADCKMRIENIFADLRRHA